MLLVDHQIRHLCLRTEANPEPMIEPFAEATSGGGIISYGLTHAGYDLRLGLTVFCMKSTFGEVLDPKRFKDPAYAASVMDRREYQPGDRVIIPANGYLLGHSLEYLRIPRHVKSRCVGKSSLARCAVSINTTPLEPAWCMSDDTDILTSTGWCPLRDVQLGELVLTRRADGLAEYQPVLAKQAFPYEGDLLHFAGRSVDQLVTPDHQLFVHRRTTPAITHTGKVPARDVFGCWNYSFDRTVTWQGPTPETLHIAGRQWPASDFLEFYGSWLGDGSAYYGNDGGYHIKLAVVTKEAKRRAFKDVLQRLDIKAALHERGFHFYDKRLSQWLQQFGHARQKFIHREFLLYGPATLQHLLRGLMQSDGCARTQSYSTSSARLADDVQELVYKCGMASIVRKVQGYFHGSATSQHIVRVCDTHMKPKVRPTTHAKVPYRGTVYDVTVPNHVFFSRRNGKASWTGNCGHLTIEIANDGPLPVAVYAGEGIAQLEFELLAAHCETDYAEKGGQYQGQTGVTMARVRE